MSVPSHRVTLYRANPGCLQNAPVKSSSKSCVKTVACEETKTDAKEAVPEGN